MSTQVRLSSQIKPESVTFTTTGNIDDLDFGNAALIRMNNASLATIRGLKAGQDGQIVTIVSIGAGEVDLAHQNAGSSAANRLINNITSGITPLAAGVGESIYQYDATTARWRLVSHEQGSWINVAYSAGNYSQDAGTWTVDAGDQTSYAFRVNGTTLEVDIKLDTTSITGTVNQLYVTLPNGYTCAVDAQWLFPAFDNGTGNPVIGLPFISSSGTQVKFAKQNGAAWTASVNATYLRFIAGFPIN